MYGNSFFNGYSPQANIDKINNQIAELERMKSQIPMQQPTNLTQNFQLAPANRDVIKYVNSIDDVQKEMVVGETPYFSKDMSVVWIKNSKGEIKSYAIEEIIQKDDKDIKIEYLQAQIEELKKEIKNEPNANIDDTIAEPIKGKEPTIIETIPRFSKKSR